MCVIPTESSRRAHIPRGGGANGPDGVDGFPQTSVLLEEASGTIHILLGLHMDHSGS